MLTNILIYKYYHQYTNTHKILINFKKLFNMEATQFVKTNNRATLVAKFEYTSTHSYCYAKFNQLISKRQSIKYILFTFKFYLNSGQ